MREIKFRAWDEQNHEMHSSFEWISSGNQGNDWIVFRSDRQQLSSKPHPFENPYFRQQYKIMQYAGLGDKNGKEIYEGDIVKGNIDEEEFIFAVSWIEDRDKNGWNVSNQNVEDGIEVIGNIYENPELLKGE